MGQFDDWIEACDFRDKYGEPTPVNVFYLDHCPVAAARAHCDVHVRKMLVETCQLLSGVWHVTQPSALEFEYIDLDSLWSDRKVLPYDTPGGAYHLGRQRIYKPTHLNHPSAKWARESTGNYDWLWRLGAELLVECKFRFKKDHASGPVLYTLEGAPTTLKEGAQTQPTPVVPEELCVSENGYYDSISSYRSLYVGAKQALLVWTRREPPAWLVQRNNRWELAARA